MHVHHCRSDTKHNIRRNKQQTIGFGKLDPMNSPSVKYMLQPTRLSKYIKSGSLQNKSIEYHPQNLNASKDNVQHNQTR
ncbi:hypothetical protein MTR_7g114935 [Medicago truncatula]|uniref:Uncharacterized protein n=1 Tax=Medicago truncatula TaxID=3880 RepID=A0A072U478_MEDTR|nr:hypothetical protein MTR_7g114935 [Medicago truncatula]